MDVGKRNLRWASALMEGLVANGVGHVVVSPGSRSTPLVLACQRFPNLKTWIQPDERCAAFFALGLSKSLKMPAVVVGTSGTAPANWYPAVIEAAQDQQSLILISADRPAELLECGANQTIDQTRLFGNHTRAFFQLAEPNATQDLLRYVRHLAARAVDQSRWPLPGPVHINVPFREPLVPATPWDDEHDGVRHSTVLECAPLGLSLKTIKALATELSGGEGLIVCGRSDFPKQFAVAVSELARRLSCPIMADPLSGLRFGPHDRSLILSHYDAFLRCQWFSEAHRPKWVLRFGAMPTSKILQRYLQRMPSSNTILVVAYGPRPDPDHLSNQILHSDPRWLCNRLLEELAVAPMPVNDWGRAFVTQDQRAAQLIYEQSTPPLEAQVLQTITVRCPQHSTVFCGNSLVIRDADSFLSGGEKSLNIVGNRGASGIDGNVSTVLGLASVARTPVVGLLGDVALYHDMNGLLAARDTDATLIVFNNGGGAIFSYLPQATLSGFERFWMTPLGIDFADVARLYGLNHARVHDGAQFDASFKRSLDTAGVTLIEVVIDREHSVVLHRQYWESVANCKP